MIAPIRESQTTSASARSLATARRAVADTLLKRADQQPRGKPRVGNLVAWTFVLWAGAIAISYVTLGAWWKIPRY